MMRDRSAAKRHGISGSRRLALAALALVTLAVGCGGPVEPPPVREAIEPFVGTWDAEVFDVTSVEDTTVVADLMVNGDFTINIQESGTYTATLTFGGIPIVEIGQMSVSEGFITLRPNGGDPATSAFSFQAPDYLILDGPTDFDFNQDLVLDPAEAHIEIRRR